MDLFSLFGASEKPKEQLEPSPDEVFSNGAPDDFSEDSFDNGSEPEPEEVEEPLEVPVAATSTTEPPVEPEPVLAPVVTPAAPVVNAENFTPTKEPATMSDLKSEILNLSDAEFAALLKAREDKKKEALKGDKLEAITTLLSKASYDDLVKVEGFVKAGFKVKAEGEDVDNETGEDSSSSSRIHFDLKPEHTVENLVSALAKGKSYTIAELLAAVGIEKDMNVNGAASFEAYSTKYKNKVLAVAKKEKKIATEGLLTKMVYFVV